MQMCSLPCSVTQKGHLLIDVTIFEHIKCNLVQNWQHTLNTICISPFHTRKTLYPSKRIISRRKIEEAFKCSIHCEDPNLEKLKAINLENFTVE